MDAPRRYDGVGGGLVSRRVRWRSGRLLESRTAETVGELWAGRIGTTAVLWCTVQYSSSESFERELGDPTVAVVDIDGDSDRADQQTEMTEFLV